MPGGTARRRAPGTATPGASTGRAASTPAASERVAPAPAADVRTLRVPAEKIDHLLDVAGEIMQYRTRLAHSLGGQAGQAQDVAEAFGGG